MPEPLGVIKNVLELERSKNFTNSSVSGGMENFINYLEFWHPNTDQMTVRNPAALVIRLPNIRADLELA